ncbi:MAG: hypothetical protein OEY50_10005 [Nitrospinota bacterium]|nr:hypothetical protein [Nitrospinota bacterium]MDH5678408.1 hypothetical protein [Nitrospinota bacterium]MDH5757291.1 hypothetical protein [Nitrospinota bacterium]
MDEREYINRISPGRRDINQRMVHRGFVFPFGAYPEEPFDQRIGYDSRFIEDSGLYNYEISVSHERVLSVFISLLRLMPGQAHVVAQVHTDDYYRECDSYVSETPVSVADLIDWIMTWRSVAADDGFFGIGAFCDEPAAEVFLDEHKSIHMYHHDPQLIETTLEGMGIPFRMGLRFFWDEPHYHEPLPLSDEDSDDFLSAFEDLADKYGLMLEDEEDDNIDEDGDPMGVTCWRVEVRGYRQNEEDLTRRDGGFYSTYYLNAASRFEAGIQVETYLEHRQEHVDLYLQMARVPLELLTANLRDANKLPGEPGVWLETDKYEFDIGHRA